MKVLVTASDSAVGKRFLEKYGTSFCITAVEKYDADLTDIRRVLEVIKRDRPDAVVHLDEMRYDFKSVSPGDTIIENYNVVCFKNFQTACKTYGVKKLIVLGSGREYGASAEVKNASEADFPVRINGADSYSESKRAISRHAEGDGLTVVFRVFDLFGQGAPADGIITDVLARLIENRPLSYKRDRLFSSIYADDAVAVIQKALTADIPPGAYNLAMPEHFLLSDILKFAKKACYKLVPIEFSEAGKLDPEYTADVSKLMGFLGADFRFSMPILAIGKTFKQLTRTDLK
jgi:nucleoside-diphosphate-sugar epimerase